MGDATGLYYNGEKKFLRRELHYVQHTASRAFPHGLSERTSPRVSLNDIHQRM